jgi:hypothetical protein
MSDLLRQIRAAIGPLLMTIDTLDTEARRQWLAELRADCPTVAREIERALAGRADARATRA